MPGDPRRARYIAQKFSEDAKLVTEERGMLGFTGTYKGSPISVQATGMGCPSAAIVTEELIQLGARNLLRIGTCGGLMVELSAAKATLAGHWEMMGLVLEDPLPTYPDGFPDDVLLRFENETGRGVLGNRPASGTQIIEELGPEQGIRYMRTSQNLAPLC
jgi:hypothetical protein